MQIIELLNFGYLIKSSEQAMLSSFFHIFMADVPNMGETPQYEKLMSCETE